MCRKGDVCHNAHKYIVSTSGTMDWPSPRFIFRNRREEVGKPTDTGVRSVHSWPCMDSGDPLQSTSVHREIGAGGGQSGAEERGADQLQKTGQIHFRLWHRPQNVPLWQPCLPSEHKTNTLPFNSPKNHSMLRTTLEIDFSTEKKVLANSCLSPITQA